MKRSTLLSAKWSPGRLQSGLAYVRYHGYCVRALWVTVPAWSMASTLRGRPPSLHTCVAQAPRPGVGAGALCPQQEEALCYGK